MRRSRLLPALVLLTILGLLAWVAGRRMHREQIRKEARQLVGEALLEGTSSQRRTELFRRARAADPTYAVAPCETAVRLQKQSRHAQAAAGFRLCFENDPRQSYARFLYAQALLRWRGDEAYVEARSTLRLFLEQAAQDPVASRDVAGRRTAEQMVEDLEELLRGDNPYVSQERYSVDEIRRILSRPHLRGVSRYDGPRLPLRLGFRPADVSLSAVGREQLGQVARALQYGGLAGATIQIEGHTDSVEGRTRRTRLDIALRRAESVRSFLVNSHGIAEGRLGVVGLGEDYPLEPNGTSAGRDANRRVELVNLTTRDLVRGDARSR